MNVLLGMLPAGIAEMSLTAEALGLLVPLVTAMQMLRLMRGLFLAGPVFLCWSRCMGIGQERRRRHAGFRGFLPWLAANRPGASPGGFP